MVRYYVSDNDSLKINYNVSKDTPVTFTVLEYSYDLLDNAQFSINKRPEHMMPKPFVVTDAVAVKKTIDINLLKITLQDSINFIQVTK